MDYTKPHLSRQNLIQRYNDVRNWTNKIAAPLKPEDCVIQSMPDVSPTKWHMAHVSWFFEVFILEKNYKNYKPLNPLFNYLFNSYYVQVGERWIRSQRGILSRPTVKEVYEYRQFIDLHMNELLETADEEQMKNIAVLVDIGINHEQQHQELMLTDIKHVFSFNPMNPVYAQRETDDTTDIPNIKWIEYEKGLYDIGYSGLEFYFDNEQPEHKYYINNNFAIADRLVTNGEYIEFIEDGGYSNAPLWLSSGFATVDEEGWDSPLYWKKIDGEWHHYTLSGFRKIILSEPVCHVSRYEADAYAQWKGCRLPSEQEWEVAVEGHKILGNFIESKIFHPSPLDLSVDTNKLHQVYGDVWEWTKSDYSPYPGYKTPEGAVGEYNGKFMSGQYVLKGGSCATSNTHIRKTYRNFFYSKDRWQFMGIRLAKDL